jgi:RecB family exonuclease
MARLGPPAPVPGTDPPASVAGTDPSAWSTPPPEAVSYSSFADHARCGYGYYLRRVVGLPEVGPPPALDPERVRATEAGGSAVPDPVAERSAGAARGRIVHALLERLDFARPVAPGEAAVRAAAGGHEPDPGEAAAIAGLVGAFGRSPLCARLAVAAAVTREASFAIPVGDLLVGGYIDVLAREADGGILVVDYKTDRVGPETDLAARVAGDYEIQRRIYGLAGLRTGAASVEVAYCFLRRPEEVVSVRYAAGDAGELERELDAAAAPLVAGRFPVSPRPHRGLCATCPGRARLCSWGEDMTLSEQVAMHEE